MRARAHTGKRRSLQRGLLATVVLFVGVLLVPTNLLAQFAAPWSEYSVKAAFLTKFPSFVDWPSQDAEQPVKICLYGSDPFGSVIDDLAQASDARPLEVERIESVNAALACEVLFIPHSEMDNSNEVLSQLRQHPVLTVGDAPTFLSRGGMIEMTVENRNIRFSMNEQPTIEAGLKVSSKLYGLAKHVLRGKAEGS